MYLLVISGHFIQLDALQLLRRLLGVLIVRLHNTRLGALHILLLVVWGRGIHVPRLSAHGLENSNSGYGLGIILL
jgi:hypothetical protein